MRANRGSEVARKVLDKLKKNKIALIVLLAGVLLLLIPFGGGSDSKTSDSGSNLTADFSLEETEERIEAALSKIDGAGKVTVVLTLKTSTRRLVAQDEDSSEKTGGDGETTESESDSSVTTVIVSGDEEDAVTLQYVYPEYMGALVVAEGAGSPEVKLHLTEAVASLTGLGTDKISVIKMKNS